MTTSIKQKERSKIIKEKILDISLNLFILNGYKSTTVINLIFDGFTDAMKNGDRIEIRDLEVIL
jgi:nucleoid DNA-binding protein